MPRACTVCSHSHRKEIDAALVRGVSPYRVEASYTGLKKSSIQRHAELHISQSLLKAQELGEVAHADNLLSEMRGLHRQTLDILDEARAAEDLKTALSAIREARGNVELLGKLSGDLDDRPQVNVLIDDRVQQVIVDALEPYDAAKYAVARALKELQGERVSAS